jgi:hypothetical protein
MHADLLRPAGTIRAGFSRSGRPSCQSPSRARVAENMNEPAPFLGEVREFREHIPIPLAEKAGDEPFVPGFRYAAVERVWNGEKWVRTDQISANPLDAPAPSTRV